MTNIIGNITWQACDHCIHCAALGFGPCAYADVDTTRDLVTCLNWEERE
jgi:hypothetical protein